ncbi:MAG: ClpXP protease specificity-enhancing factor [Acidiferrobacterales bacterium]
MVSIKPYLIRAAYQWALDNGFTPHLLADATVFGVVAPAEYIEDGRIVFNVDPHATSNLIIADDRISFSARFTGKPFEVNIPMNAVLGVYTRENGEGISFPPEMVAGSEDVLEDDPAIPDSSRGKPDLKIIK